MKNYKLVKATYQAAGPHWGSDSMQDGTLYAKDMEYSRSLEEAFQRVRPKNITPKKEKRVRKALGI